MITLDPISIAESSRYMGIKGEPDENIKSMLKRCEKTVRERLRPNYVYRTADIEIHENGLIIGGINFEGNDIKKHLEGCSKAVLMAVTVSAEADKMIRQLSVNNMTEALAVDCLCSSAVEQVCNKAETEIFSQIKAPYRTWRFSAGYGDLPIAVQKDILYFLNAQRRIGLTVTESCLLMPSKSVTAVVGISEEPLKPQKKGCAVCSMRDRCAFSAEGKTCGR